MSIDSLRWEATALSSHAAQCDGVADEIDIRNAALSGVFDTAISLHTTSTWDSPTATTRRQALNARNDDLDGVRTDLTNISIRLRGQADWDREQAQSKRNTADALERQERQRQLDAAAAAAATPVGAS